MSRIGVDYRVSLLKAAAIHGSSHQASMVFQVIVPKQLREIEIGLQRIQFLSQKPEYFKALNVPGRLTQFKSSSGFVNAAGIELTILDSIRYFHRAAGINGAAQIAHDLGAKASPRKLARAAVYYENAAVRRLGYLFDLFGHKKQAKALLPFAGKAKSMKPLDPSAKSSIRAASPRVNRKWMVRLNQAVEIDGGFRRLTCRSGGTAIHKLLLSHPLRYSEDIDLVQMEPGPIGKTVDGSMQTRAGQPFDASNLQV